ncbi:MAG TPA: peptidase S9, partial [Marinilabiliales bacterium]|nr:peptidase S9 [Marinilabiliales bacterium]
MKKLFWSWLFTGLALASCQSNKMEIKTEEVSDFSGSLTAEEIEKGILTPEILWKFGRLSGGELSPDGQSVLYSVTYYDAKTLKKTSNIYVVPATGGTPKKLTEDRFMDVSPVWTPDGKQIAFLSNRYGDYQVWVMNPDGSARVPFTDIEGGVNAFRLSPDGKHLLYLK